MYLHTVDKDFLLMHGRHNLYFKLHVHGRIHFCRRPQVVNPWFNVMNADFLYHLLRLN